MVAATLAVACVAGCQKPASDSAAPATTSAATSAADTATNAADTAQNAAARAADAAAEAASASPAAPPGSAWYIADVNFTSCFKSDSPADKIQELRDAGGNVRTSDKLDGSGQLASVEVAVDEANGLQQRYWTFYRSQEACEAKIAADSTIPDKYR